MLYYSGPSTEDSSEVPFHSRKKKSQIEKPASEIAEGIEPHDFFKMLHSKCIWQPLYWWFVGLGDDAMADDAAATVVLVHSGPKIPPKKSKKFMKSIFTKKNWWRGKLYIHMSVLCLSRIFTRGDPTQWENWDSRIEWACILARKFPRLS